MSNIEIILLICAVVAGILALVQAFRADFQDFDAIGLVVLCIGIAAYLLL